MTLPQDFYLLHFSLVAHIGDIIPKTFTPQWVLSGTSRALDRPTSNPRLRNEPSGEGKTSSGRGAKSYFRTNPTCHSGTASASQTERRREMLKMMNCQTNPRLEKPLRRGANSLRPSRRKTKKTNQQIKNCKTKWNEPSVKANKQRSWREELFSEQPAPESNNPKSPHPAPI